MTNPSETAKRMQKQRKHHQYQYAWNIVHAENRELRMEGFKTHARIYGREWAENIWSLCKKIDEDRKK